MQRFQTFLQALLRLKGRGKVALGDVQALDEPIRAFECFLVVEAAAEDPAGFQDTAGLPVGGILVREGVEAVQGRDQVEAFILEGQLPHVALD